MPARDMEQCVDARHGASSFNDGSTLNLVLVPGVEFGDRGKRFPEGSCNAYRPMVLAPSSSQNRWSDQGIGVIANGRTRHGLLVRSKPGRSESPAETRGPSARGWSRWAGLSTRRSGVGSRRSPAVAGRQAQGVMTGQAGAPEQPRVGVWWAQDGSQQRVAVREPEHLRQDAQLVEEAAPGASLVPGSAATSQRRSPGPSAA